MKSRNVLLFLGIFVILGLVASADAVLTDAFIFTVNGQPQPAEIIVYPSASVELDLELAAGHDISGYTLVYKILQGNAEMMWGNVTFPMVFEFPSFVITNATPTEVMITGVQFFNPNIPGPGVIMQGLQLHCLGLDLIPAIVQVSVAGGTVVDGWQEIPVGTILSTLVIHQIPEPMTLMLLGFGGLFLRRKH